MKRRDLREKHGGIKFLRTGVVPVGMRHIVDAVEKIVDEIIDDLGGPQEITGTQKVLIGAIKTDLIFLGIVTDWLQKQPSIIDKAGQMLPPLNSFLAYQNTVTRNCRELGLKRVKPLLSMEGYLEAKATEAHGEQTEKPTSEHTGAAENASLRASCEDFSGDIQ
ncbi:MAG: hypothetical protein ABII93_05720 [Chrysiogenia bacterium]